MRQRQYAREILNADRFDLDRQAFLDLYKRDGFGINDIFGFRLETLLHRAVRDSNGDKVGMINKLVENGASVHTKSGLFRKRNPLQLASDLFGANSEVALRLHEVHRAIVDFYSGV